MTEKEEIFAAIDAGNAAMTRLDGNISHHKVLQLVRAAVAPNARDDQRARFGFGTLDARGSRNLAKAKSALLNI